MADESKGEALVYRRIRCGFMKFEIEYSILLLGNMMQSPKELDPGPYVRATVWGIRNLVP